MTTMGGYSFMNRGASLDVLDSGTNQFYSPQLSTDFLEKPQNLRERRAFYRFFYNTNEIVGRAIDVHTELPLSKLRLVPPRGKNRKQCEYIFKFFEKMCDTMKLFRALIEISHEYNLFGNCFVFAEDSDYREDLTPEEAAQKMEESRQRSERIKELGVIDKDPMYAGWKKLLILPPDQVRVRKLPLTDDVAIEYVPDPETRKFITSDMPLYPDIYQDMTGPEGVPRKRYEIPSDIKQKVQMNGTIPLDTDPYTGSHVYHLARRKSQYEPLGVSAIERCVNTLVYLDKLRQAQTSIASRHMTPMRVVWAEDLNPDNVDSLREQVDLALVDPDYSIIANYEIHWEEMGSSGRLLDLSSEMEQGLERLLIGLGLTREVLTGEGTYTGSRVSLEIMNTQYLLFREIIQDYVENYLFKPVAKRKGFVEVDEYGNETLLFPRLSFTRLAIRDNEQFFDQAFQLYQKGSISVDLILDILNIDPDATRHKIESDMFTVNDNQYNELLRNVYTNVATGIVEQTDVLQKLADYMHLKVTVKPPEAEGASRFSSVQDPDLEKKLAKIVSYFRTNPELIDRVFKNGQNNGSSTHVGGSTDTTSGGGSN